MLMTWSEILAPLLLVLLMALAGMPQLRVRVAVGMAEDRFITGRRAARQRRLRERWSEAYGRGSFPEGL